jgi:hypothetical protein
MEKTKLKIGVYFSANDAVYDWALAFLNSFRRFNPGLPLYLIPFNDNCEKLLELQEKYRFEIYSDPSFVALEQIGKDFELGHSAYGPYWFRRYAAFWGPLDRFMYLDARQVVLDDLTKFIEALDQYGFDFLYYDCAIDQVYEPGPVRTSFLKRGKGRGFNSGRWVTKKGLFSLEEFQQRAAECMQVRDQLNPRNTDQAFINYCVDSRDDIISGHLAEVLGGYCHQGWAGQQGKVYEENGQYYLWDYGGLDHKKRLFLLHWAGIERNLIMPKKKVFTNFSSSSLSFMLTFKSYLRYPMKYKFVNQLYHNISREANF